MYATLQSMMNSLFEMFVNNYIKVTNITLHIHLIIHLPPSTSFIP